MNKAVSGTADKWTGTCLCGAVRYRLDGHKGIFQNCHCSRCRKFTGGAYAPNIIAGAEQFRWLAGEEFVGRYALPESRYFTTAFCTRCGSSLPWLAKGGKAVVVPAGTLDDAPDMTPMQNIFYDSRASWHTDAAALKTYPAKPDKADRAEK